MLFLLSLLLCLSIERGIDAKSKTAIFILGMHRSGTSVTAGILYNLGIYSGKKLIGRAKKNSSSQLVGHMPAKSKLLYPKFEHYNTCTLNNYVLSGLGTSWQDSSDFLINWDIDLSKYYKKIEKVWSQDLLKHNVFFVKDPRLSLLLPLYLEFAKYKGYTPKLIIVYRDLSEIAMSVSYRSSTLSYQESYRLAQKYYQQIEKYSKGYDVLILNYAEILNSLNTVLENLRKFLSLSSITARQKKLLQNFVNKSQRHFINTAK